MLKELVDRMDKKLYCLQALIEAQNKSSAKNLTKFSIDPNCSWINPMKYYAYSAVFFLSNNNHYHIHMLMVSSLNLSFLLKPMKFYSFTSFTNWKLTFKELWLQHDTTIGAIANTLNDGRFGYMVPRGFQVQYTSSIALELWLGAENENGNREAKIQVSFYFFSLLLFWECLKKEIKFSSNIPDIDLLNNFKLKQL